MQMEWKRVHIEELADVLELQPQVEEDSDDETERMKILRNESIGSSRSKVELKHLSNM